jgi:hypothetical protein
VAAAPPRGMPGRRWPMRQRQRPVATGRRGEALALRDACMLLAARRGVQREVGGAPVLETGLGPFTVRLTQGDARRPVTEAA